MLRIAIIIGSIAKLELPLLDEPVPDSQRFRWGEQRNW